MSKVFIVTGTSRGIGEAIVEKLCGIESTKVVVGIARSRDKLETLKTKFNTKFDYVCGDVTNGEDLNKLVDLVKSKYKKLDGLIANAGVLSPVQDVNHLDVDQWKKLFDVNFFSVVSLTGKILPLLRESCGNLVFVSSGASTKPYYGWGAYGSSKAAINHFALSVAAEEPSVGVLSVAPGVVDTQMQDDIRDTFGPAHMTKDALQRFVQLKDNNQLLHPSVPAAVYANLVSRGIPKDLNGLYLRYNDDKLSSFSE